MTTNNTKMNTSAAEFVPVTKWRGSNASAASEASTVQSKKAVVCFKCKLPGHKDTECKSCFKCKLPGHKAKECKMRQYCNGCGAEGHFVRDCPKLINKHLPDAHVSSTRPQKGEKWQVKQLQKRQEEALKRK